MWRYFRDQHGKGPGCWNWVPCMQQWLCLNLMHPTGLAGFHTTCGSTGELLLKPPRISQYSKNATNTNPKPPQNLRSAIISCLISWWKNPPKWSKATHVARIHLDFGASDPKFFGAFFLNPRSLKITGAKRVDPPFFHLKAKLFVTMASASAAFPRAFVRCWESRLVGV